MASLGSSWAAVRARDIDQPSPVWLNRSGAASVGASIGSCDGAALSGFGSIHFAGAGAINASAACHWNRPSAPTAGIKAQARASRSTRPRGPKNHGLALRDTISTTSTLPMIPPRSSSADVSNSPRESFLADRNRRIGRIDYELAHLEEIRAIVERIDALSAARAALNDEIDRVEKLLRRLMASATARTNKAMALIGSIGRNILKQDLSREDAFDNPTTFSINFGDDAMLVDGKMNFAESSNVVLKNAAIHDPLKQWKLSPMDVEARSRWEQYTKAKEAMLERCHIPEAPWHIVQAVDKKKARLNCIAHLLEQIPYNDVPRDRVLLPARIHNPDYHRGPIPPEMYIADRY